MISSVSLISTDSSISLPDDIATKAHSGSPSARNSHVIGKIRGTAPRTRKSGRSTGGASFASRSRWTLTTTTLSLFLNESAMTSRSHLCARGDMSRFRLPLLAAWAFGLSMACAPRMASAQDSFENPGQALREPQTCAPKPKAAVTAATWGESDPAPAGYHLEHHWRRKLVVGGAGLFVLAYAFSAAAAAASSDARALWIPIGGPVVQMTQLRSNQGDIVQADGLAMVLLVFDCIAQTVGAGMVTYGIAVPENRLVKNGDASFWIAPSPVSLSRGAVGVGLVGSF